MRLPQYDREAALELLREPPDALLAPSDIAAKAHRRWDLKQYENAAALFCLAAERASASHEEPNQFPNYAVRAAITLSLAGRADEAKATLQDATAFDWKSAGLPNDTNMIEWAFSRLLLDVVESSPQQFAALFEQAVSRCSEVGIAYPRIHPQQESLLSAAVLLGEWDAVTRIIDLMSKRRPLSRPARAQLAEARMALANATD